MYYTANIFFEDEIEGRVKNLAEAFSINPLFKELQFLPLLYLSDHEVLFTNKSYEKTRLIDDAKETGILRSWAASKILSEWAAVKGLVYDMPSFECAKRINSKLWTYRNLKKESIVFSEKELPASGNWVLKTDQGFAGRGHCIFHEKKAAVSFAKQEWKKGVGVILEPWRDRVLDFSSQWLISKQGKIQLLGLTKCLNTPSGVYLGTEAGDEQAMFGKWLPFALEHIEFCKDYLQIVAKEGFFGNLGVDAMVYKDSKNRFILDPVLEVNARMTMSAAILLYHQKRGGRQVTTVHYGASKCPGLLPFGKRKKLFIVEK